MLCSHVVFRQSARRSHARLASTAAEVRKPRGRQRKTPIPVLSAVAEQAQQPEYAATAKCSDLPRRRGPGRHKNKSLLDGNALGDGKGDPSRTSGSKKSTAKEVVVLKKPKTPAMKRAKSPKRRQSRLALPQKHHDLASFLDYAAKANLKTGTNVYKGHHYEYTVVEALKRYDFTLQKMGRSNDLGIDLLGTWNLPMEPRELRVLIQCKASRPKPSFVRELAGAYAGAPAGWKGEDVMALLITRDPATLGVREALQRSRSPMGFAQITELGIMKQFMWNYAAGESRLTGMSVTNIYPKAAPGLLPSSLDGGRLPGAISLLWMGKRWSGANVPLRSIVEPLKESHHVSIL